MISESVEILKEVPEEVIETIRKHREEFLALMSKMRLELPSDVLTVHATDDEDNIIENPEQKLIDEIVMGHYVIGFLGQQIKSLENVEMIMAEVIGSGMTDGEAYAEIQQMMRH